MRYVEQDTLVALVGDLRNVYGPLEAMYHHDETVTHRERTQLSQALYHLGGCQEALERLIKVQTILE